MTETTPDTPDEPETITVEDTPPAPGQYTPPSAPTPAAAPPADSGTGAPVPPAIEDSVQLVTLSTLPKPAMHESLQGDATSMNVELDVTVELGRAGRTLKQLLDFKEGLVVPLYKRAGEPVDVVINGRPVARGEVVVLNDRIGVRITEVISQFAMDDPV